MDLDKAISELRKEFGQESIFTLKEGRARVKSIPTGSIALDKASGIAGWPRGRLVEVFGPESAGKTTICLHAIAEAQKVGKVAFIDVEHAFDPVYAQALGVDIENMFFSQPASAEEALTVLKKLCGATGVSMVVLDSLAGLATRQQLEGGIEDANIASVARVLSQQLKQVATTCGANNCTAMFTNQLREKPGVMYGSPEYTPGGKAIKFYASIRVRVSRDGSPEEDAGMVPTKAKFVKNKCAMPFTTAEFEIKFGRGIDDNASIADMAIEMGLFEKKGSWIYYNGQQVAQGRTAFIDWLSKLPAESRDKIKKKILK